jgi:hypothetical protein
MPNSTTERSVAAGEIPRAEFTSLEERDHVGGAHLAQVDPVLPAVLHTPCGNG